MATFNKFDCFLMDLCKKLHNFNNTGDTFKVYLTNAAPNNGTHVKKGDIAEIAAGNNYTAGGIDIAKNSVNSGGTITIGATDAKWTAAGGTIGPFRYAVIYNDSDATGPDILVGWYDYGQAVTLQDGEDFTVDFGASWMTLS